MKELKPSWWYNNQKYGTPPQGYVWGFFGRLYLEGKEPDWKNVNHNQPGKLIPGNEPDIDKYGTDDDYDFDDYE